MKLIKTIALSTAIIGSTITTTVKPASAQTFESSQGCTCDPYDTSNIQCYGCNNYPNYDLENNWSSDIYYY